MTAWNWQTRRQARKLAAEVETEIAAPVQPNGNWHRARAEVSGESNESAYGSRAAQTEEKQQPGRGRKAGVRDRDKNPGSEELISPL